MLSKKLKRKNRRVKWNEPEISSRTPASTV